MKRIFGFLVILFVSVSASCAHRQVNDMEPANLPIPSESKLYEVVVKHVMIDQSTGENKIPVIILANKGNDNQILPIWVGASEGLSINMALKKQNSPRPGTHDLFKILLGEFQVKLVKVVITEVRNEIYIAAMTMESHGEIKEIDARPSDAIAIALRTDTPIFVSESVISKSGWLEVPNQDKDKDKKKPEPVIRDDKSI